MRALTPLQFPDITPGPITSVPPRLAMVRPADLYVDDSYQRGLTDRSIRLIKKIVAEWDWCAFKPPVVVTVADRYEIIDGQHTAIAALTHGIVELPVMVVEAEAIDARANAFVRHNRDRIRVSPTQLHNAMVAAGDEDELTVHQVCERAGVTILRNPPALGKFKVGDTLAVVAIRALVNRRFALGARKVLDVCVQAGAAPVSANMIKAVEHLLYSEKYRDDIEADRILAVLQALGDTIENEARRFAAERNITRWRAMASVIFMNRRKARGA